ncbi:MAG: PEP-CTERM sorting domain-containing protein [Pirellulales bacterium]|nr:PEP-CTERM sorting domain-containing protein [Pirellulales bacterium]
MGVPNIMSQCMKLSLNLAVSALLFLLPGPARADVGLSLNLVFNNPASPSSGGTWELAVLSPAGEGVAGVLAVLGGIDDPSGQLTDPSGTHDLVGSNPAFVEESAGIYQVAYGQDFVAPVLGVGDPNGPFAATDHLGDPAWDGQTIVTTGGTFSGTAPQWDPSGAQAATQVNIFTGGGSGAAAAAVATPVVRSNLGAPADFNIDGAVNNQDYLRWVSQFGQTYALFAGADGNGDGLVGAADYTVWQDGLTGSSSVVIGVPEPSTGALLVFAGLCGAAFGRCKNRTGHRRGRPRPGQEEID